MEGTEYLDNNSQSPLGKGESETERAIEVANSGSVSDVGIESTSKLKDLQEKEDERDLKIRKLELENKKLDIENKRLELENEQFEANKKERQKMSLWVKWAVSLVLFFSVGGIFTYLLLSFLKKEQMPDSAVLITWLSSTVVEVIGIMYVIARYLFPQSGIGEETEKSSSAKKDK
ncbi:hypothetical protein [Rothia mucilaginosa]|jgi:hypothetical protein|uniref:hypothetical protein n=1 Tax=Rothia mucilaginosa TaxID=43675 RepID=UPI0028F052B0|nr:hypothetical protein [Rothia mucilaginosa]